jgi:hypothetical protein
VCEALRFDVIKIFVIVVNYKTVLLQFIPVIQIESK